MTLGEILERIRGFDDESFIYVEGGPYPSPSAKAVVIPINADTQAPAPVGTECFIEVYHAVDVLAAWSQHRQGQTPTALEMIDAIWYFRKHNAYLLPAPIRRTRPRSRKVVIASFGAAAAVAGCSSFVAAWAAYWHGIASALNDAGVGFLGDAIELIYEVGLVPMTLGALISGVLVAAVLTNRLKRTKE
jgi:hypothetical protein